MLMEILDVLPEIDLAATLPPSREASEEGFMLQHAATTVNSGVFMRPAGSGPATLSRGCDALYAYKGRPRPPEPAKAPAPAPKDGAAPAPKPAETPKPAEKSKDGK